MTIKVPYSLAQNRYYQLANTTSKTKVKSTSNKHPKQSNSVLKAQRYHQTHQFLPLLLPTSRAVWQPKPFWKSNKKASITNEKKLNFWRGGSLNLKARFTLLKQLTVFFKQKSTTRSNICSNHALLPMD